MGASRRLAVVSGLATALVLAAAGHPAHGAIDRPHSLAFKIGYHTFPHSSYFDLTEANFIGGVQDFAGESLELFDYTYQWPSRWSLNVSLLGGYYQEFVPTQNAQHSLFVHTMTVTPVYRIAGSDAIKAMKLYGGIGLGRYAMNLRFDFTQGDSTEIHTYTLGYQALLGTEYRYNEQVGLLLESKLSRARIRFGSELGDLEIDVGGLNILAGFRIHF